MRYDLQEFAFDVEKWSDSVFGKDRESVITILLHLQKEIPELIEALENLRNFQPEYKGLDWTDRNGGNFITTDKSHNEYCELQHKVFEEYADCFMLLVDSATHFPMTMDALIASSKRKLEVNKKRKWKQPDENGVIEHEK